MNHAEKILDLGRSVLLHPPSSPELVSSYFHLLFSTKSSEGQKFPQEDQVKIFVEILSSKPAEFYLNHLLPFIS